MGPAQDTREHWRLVSRRLGQWPKPPCLCCFTGVSTQNSSVNPQTLDTVATPISTLTLPPPPPSPSSPAEFHFQRRMYPLFTLLLQNMLMRSQRTRSNFFLISAGIFLGYSIKLLVTIKQNVKTKQNNANQNIIVFLFCLKFLFKQISASRSCIKKYIY